MTVYPFDPHAHARTTDPDTSHAAARQLRPTSMLRKCLWAFWVAGPMTSDECVTFLGYDPARGTGALGRGDGAWKRISDLTVSGFIADTGARRRSERSGRMQIVRGITDSGRKALGVDRDR